MPEWLFSTYDRAQPRLEAEEHMLLLKTLVAGTGHMEDKDLAAFQGELLRAAGGGDKEQGPIGFIRPKSADEMRALISGAEIRGFKVEVDGEAK